jgi:hypothetical protein
MGLGECILYTGESSRSQAGVGYGLRAMGYGLSTRLKGYGILEMILILPRKPIFSLMSENSAESYHGRL